MAGLWAWPQEDDVPPEDEVPEIEVIKQLVFIEEFLYEEGVYDGIESPYDVRVAPDGNHVYVASLKNDAVTYFARDEANGELTYMDFVTESDIGENALNGVRSLALSPDGAYLYGVAMFSDSLSTFARNSVSGALTFVDAIYDTDGGVDGLGGPRSIVVSPDGKNLYVAAHDDNKVSVYSRNSETGAASFLAVYEEGDQGVEELSRPHALALSPDGKHLYVALWSNDVIVFARNAQTGLLTYKSKLSYLTGETSKTSPRALALSPDGEFLYIASANNDAISVFSRNPQTGKLTSVGQVKDEVSGVVDLDGPHAISISSDGKYVYIAAVSSDSVTSFERDAETGLITYYQSISAGEEDDWTMNGPISIGTSPDGEHVYLGAGSGTHSVLTFRREILVDPPEFVVQPVDQQIEEEETVAFYALAQGVDLSYQWVRDGVDIPGEVLPVLTLPLVQLSDNGGEFKIRVSNPGGVLTSSTVNLSVLPPIVVNAPVDLTALDISSDSARLVWKDESDNETSFEVQRRLLGGDFSTLASVGENQIQYDDDTLEAATTYIYRLRAKRVDNVSLWSNDAVIESFDDAPQTPVNLKVYEETYNKVLLSWSDRSAVEDGFRILRRLDQLGSLWTLIGTVDKNATVYEDRSVAPLSTYAYRIQAYNESGNSDYSNSVVAITGSIPVESISPTSRSISREAFSGYTIGVNSSKDWEAISTVDWLVVTSPVRGQGTGNQGVTYRSLLNESQSERTGKIVVGGIDHTVVQDGSPPFLRLSPSRTESSGEGGTELVDIESNVEWTASENADWVSISSGQSGADYGTVVLSIDENDSFDTRFAELTVNARTHTIEQAGKVPYLDFNADETRFSSEQGTSSITVSSNSEWSVTVSAGWISLTGDVAGSGDGVIAFAVDSNESTEARTADILVNGNAVSITQDPPEEPVVPVPEVLEPEWVRVTVGPLGADLEWLDLSDDELGFRLRRTVVGSGRVSNVADLPANATTYFDRDAPRGKLVEYRLASYDAVGESDEVITVSEEIPSSNMTKVALRVEAAADTKALVAGLPIAGDGEIVMQLEGLGSFFEALSFGLPYSAIRYEIDSDAGFLEILGSSSTTDWADYFSFSEVAGVGALSEAAGRIEYGANTVSGSSAYPRGAQAMGQLLGSDSAIVVGFEIEGSFTLPILLQGSGPSLTRNSANGLSDDLRIRLYEIGENGGTSLVAENSDWTVWTNEATITLEDAISKGNARPNLSDAGGEARILVMLGEGRYVAVLKSDSGSTGTAMLEVLDAR